MLLKDQGQIGLHHVILECVIPKDANGLASGFEPLSEGDDTQRESLCIRLLY
jgi:hypothetical protein